MAPHVQLDVVELWVADIDNRRRSLAPFGFIPERIPLSCRPDEKAACLAAGDVRFVLRQGTTRASAIARHVAERGDGVGDVVLVCDDVLDVADRAVSCGLRARVEDDCARVDLLGDGTIVHTIRNRSSASVVGPSHDSKSAEIGHIDHVTYCLPFGTIGIVSQRYRDVLGLTPVANDGCRDVGDDTNGMRSVVLRSAAGFTVVLTSPASAASSGQTQRFLTMNRGAGVQHVAIACTGLLAVVRSLRSNGVRFLDVPNEHLELSYRRLQDRALPWDDLKREQILVDADQQGLLFQLFTHPIIEESGFFFELIERAGATGFGAANVRALFAAVEAFTPQART